MAGRSRTVSAIVLSSRVWRDNDRLVSVLTPGDGKIALIAKGVRKITSQRKAALQPGCLIKCAWTSIGERRVLTEAVLERGIAEEAYSLERLRDITAILEVVSTIALEETEQEELFERAEQLLAYAGQGEAIHRGVIRQYLLDLLISQGIEVPPEQMAHSVNEIIERVVGRKLRSFAFLSL